MKIGIPICLTVFCATVAAVAQVPPAGRESIADDLERSIRAAYHPVESIEYLAHVVVEENDACRKARKSTSIGRESDITFAAKGEKYFYRQVTVEKLDGKIRGCDRAFNGRQYQDLNHHTNSLMFTKHDPDRNHLELGLFTPLAAYGFLSPFVQGSGHNISWRDIKEPTGLAKMLQCIPLLATGRFGADDVITARFKTVVLRLWERPVIVNVTFDKSLNYLPIGYKYTTEKGAPLLDYRVLEVGKAAMKGDAVALYPKETLCNFYDWIGPLVCRTGMGQG